MSSPMAPGRDPIGATTSPLNGPDAMRMKKSGQITEGGTFGEFMEQAFGIKWEDPKEVGLQKLKAAAQNATNEGKARSMAAMGSGPQNQAPGMPQRPMPQGRPMAAQGGLESLMGGRR